MDTPYLVVVLDCQSCFFASSDPNIRLSTLIYDRLVKRATVRWLLSNKSIGIAVSPWDQSESGQTQHSVMPVA